MTKNKTVRWKVAQVISPTYPDGALMIKVDDSIERPVAIVPMPVGNHKAGIALQEKNAILIMSAPLLLEMSRKLLNKIDAIYDIHDFDLDDEYWDMRKTIELIEKEQ